jgi:hypothetical protein
MTPLSRNAVFQMAAKKLRQDFSSLGVVPHSGLKGDEAAKLVRDFLNGHLPKTIHRGLWIHH